MTRAIRIHQFGDPQVMRWESIEVGEPGPGQVRLRHTVAGLNFVDTLTRRGLLPNAQQLPLVPGRGGAGVVEALGQGVSQWRVGDRVAYAPVTGSYSEARLIDADQLVAVPDAVSDEVAGATILQGLTAHYLVRQMHRVEPGETLLVHAAAGGMGQILCQWGSALGARVIGTVSSQAKADLALASGCEAIIRYDREDFVARVAQLTDGRKVDVVYDGVGADTFMRSLDCLRPAGHLVSYGAASGPVPPFDLDVLTRKGALTVSKGTLQVFTQALGRLRMMGDEWFDALARGQLQLKVNQRYPLQEAARAHADLEARRTTGSTALVVG